MLDCLIVYQLSNFGGILIYTNKIKCSKSPSFEKKFLRKGGKKVKEFSVKYSLSLIKFVITEKLLFFKYDLVSSLIKSNYFHIKNR